MAAASRSNIDASSILAVVGVVFMVALAVFGLTKILTPIVRIAAPAPVVSVHVASTGMLTIESATQGLTWDELTLRGCEQAPPRGFIVPGQSVQGCDASAVKLMDRAGKDIVRIQ